MSGSVPSLSVLVIALDATAGSLPVLLQKNLAAIEASTATIVANNDVVKHSANVSAPGIKSFRDRFCPNHRQCVSRGSTPERVAMIRVTNRSEGAGFLLGVRA